MGRGMAANLQKAGHTLVVNDLSVQLAETHLANGATWVETPAALAQKTDLVFTSLPTPEIVEAVGFGENGLAAGFAKGAAWFDLSTNSVEGVRDLHKRLLELGVDFFDAPVSGGPAGAASGRLTIWVSGNKSSYDKFEPALMAMSDQIRYIGDIGSASIAKLVHNCAGAAISAIQAEVMTLGVKAGLDPLTLWAAIRQGASGRQRTHERLGTRFLQGEFDQASFQLSLLHKDVKLSIELAREVGVPLRMCNLLMQEVTEAMNRGWAERDGQSFMLLQQERAGIETIRVPKEQIQAILEREK